MVSHHICAFRLLLVQLWILPSMTAGTGQGAQGACQIMYVSVWQTTSHRMCYVHSLPWSYNNNNNSGPVVLEESFITEF